MDKWTIADSEENFIMMVTYICNQYNADDVIDSEPPGFLVPVTQYPKVVDLSLQLLYY